MTITKNLALAALIGLLTGPTVALAAKSPTGVWIDHTGRGAVEIKPCGRSLCGRIVWLQDKTNSKLCGKQIIGGVKNVGSGRWDRGWIYSPEKGSRFDVELKTLRSGKLRVLGYAGVKFLSETMIWRPAPTTLERCDTKTVRAPSPVDQPANKSTKNPDRPATGKTPENTTPAPGNTGTADATTAPKTAETEPKRENSRTAKLAPPASKNQAPEPDTGKTPNISGLIDRIPARMKTCKLDLPYLSVTFPCPE